MVMTAEQKKAKESAAKFITYLHKKYYLQLVEAKEKMEEVQKCTSFRFCSNWDFHSFPTYDTIKKMIAR